MRKRILHILNWYKYQARTDKELPWLKLWGRLFKAPWFQTMQDEEKFVTIALLDLARQFNNNIAEELIFKGYLKGNYGIFISQERIFKLCKYLVDNEFLSDNCPTNVEVEGDIDKIRVDKIRVYIGKPSSFEEVSTYFKSINSTETISKDFFEFYESKGWVVGKVPMRNWKMAANRWVRNNHSTTDNSKVKDLMARVKERA